MDKLENLYALKLWIFENSLALQISNFIFVVCNVLNNAWEVYRLDKQAVIYGRLQIISSLTLSSMAYKEA